MLYSLKFLQGQLSIWNIYRFDPQNCMFLPATFKLATASIQMIQFTASSLLFLNINSSVVLLLHCLSLYVLLNLFLISFSLFPCIIIIIVVTTLHFVDCHCSQKRFKVVLALYLSVPGCNMTTKWFVSFGCWVLKKCVIWKVTF